MIDDVPLKVYSSVEAKLRDYPKIQTIIIQQKKLYQPLTEEKLANSFTREIEDIFEYLKKALEEDLNKEEILKVINQFKVNLNLVAALEEFKDEIREGKYEEITKADNVLNSISTC